MLKDRFNLHAPLVSMSSMREEIYHGFHKSLSLHITLDQFNVINNFTECVSSIYYIINLPRKPCALKFSFLFRSF